MDYQAKQAVYLPVGDYLNLEFHLMDTRPGAKPDAFVAELVQRWLKLEMDRLAQQKEGRSARGYQWKNVFLPEGTSLRTSHQGVVEFAKVVGNTLTMEGRPLTPSEFANRRAKGRNAWRFVWLRFPGEEHWIRADHQRSHVLTKAMAV